MHQPLCLTQMNYLSRNSFNFTFRDAKTGPVLPALRAPRRRRRRDGGRRRLQEPALRRLESGVRSTRANLVLRIIAWFWCNLLEQSKLLYLIWKLWRSSFICCMAACSAPRGYRVTDLNVKGWWMRPAHLKNTSKIYLSVGPWSKFYISR